MSEQIALAAYLGEKLRGDSSASPESRSGQMDERLTELSIQIQVALASADLDEQHRRAAAHISSNSGAISELEREM